jgi:hypothetical protein
MSRAAGDAAIIKYAAEAEASTIKDVILAQSTQYKEMKSALGFSNDDIITFLKHGLVKEYARGKIAMKVDL